MFAELGCVVGLVAFAGGITARAAPTPSLFQVRSAMNRIVQETVELQQELAPLARPTDSLQFDAYGYHGGYLPALDGLPDQPRWTVELEFPEYVSPRKLFLVPSINRQFDSLRSYGFPKRFRVLTVFPDGRTQLVKEWMTRDCPDPGRMPLLIEIAAHQGHRIRIEVYRGAIESGKELFALDEVFGLAPYGLEHAVAVHVSAEYESLPYWSKEYLIDQKTSLGLPVVSQFDGAEGAVARDFAVEFDELDPDACVVELDMGRSTLLGWVDLYPAIAPEGLLIPGYGFPSQIVVEVVEEDESGGRGAVYELRGSWDHGNPGNNLVHIAGFNRSGRWIRLKCSGLPLHNGRRTFAMGEIRIYKSGKLYPVDSVRLEGFPAGMQPAALAMVDGRSNGRLVMFMLPWLEQLQQRSRDEHVLEQKVEMLARLQARWRRLGLLSGTGAGLTLLVTAIAIAVVAVVQRRRHSRQLRQQITLDLHDDIGSRLSAMALAATYLRKVSDEPKVHERSGKIERMAREMQVALADVLWFTNSETDSLSQLFARLADIAGQTVPPGVLQFDGTPLKQVPDLMVGVMFKRDLMLLFKEMVNNAVKHAEATEIKVFLLWQRPQLLLTVADNGRGFDVVEARTRQRQRPHLGLSSMERRARRLGGKFSIDSQPGAGCTVTLSVKV